ncbi:hypothetical protein QQM79_08935 [Marinobacteraceae bacterium S3BR75-40.1]
MPSRFRRQTWHRCLSFFRVSALRRELALVLLLKLAVLILIKNLFFSPPNEAKPGPDGLERRLFESTRVEAAPLSSLSSLSLTLPEEYRHG